MKFNQAQALILQSMVLIQSVHGTYTRDTSLDTVGKNYNGCPGYSLNSCTNCLLNWCLSWCGTAPFCAYSTSCATNHCIKFDQVCVSNSGSCINAQGYRLGTPCSNSLTVDPSFTQPAITYQAGATDVVIASSFNDIF